jgi:hypothetical protein
MFKTSTVGKTKIQQLVDDFPTPNTKEIVVMKPYFQRGFGFPSCDFFRGLLDHFKIELVYLNPNSILQIAVFVHLCEAFLGIPPHFTLFKYYFFLKYQSSAANHVVRGVACMLARIKTFSIFLSKLPFEASTLSDSTVRTMNQSSLLSWAAFPSLKVHGLKSPLLKKCPKC